VIAAQTALLSNQRTALNLRMQQLTASVQLIKALGGGWMFHMERPQPFLERHARPEQRSWARNQAEREYAPLAA